MAKLLKLRRGTTSQHSSFTGAEGEVTVDMDKDVLVVHDNSTQGGHPVAAEDMSNVSSASIAGRLANDSIATTKIAAGALPTDVTVASANIVDGTIVNADVNASAAIAGTKISPDFGSQQITSTGSAYVGSATITAQLPSINFVDNDDNPDFRLRNHNGDFKIIDTTNSADRLVVNSDGHIDIAGNLDVGAGIDVTGNITVTGTVDGRDINADGAKLDGIESSATADQTASEIVALVADQTIAPSTIDMEDNEKIKLGASDDLEISHNGTKSLIRGATATNIDIKTAADFFVTHADTDGSNSENCIVVRGDGEVELYHDGTKKFETTSSGISVTGAVYSSTGVFGEGTANNIDFTTDDRMGIHINGSEEFRFESDGDFHADGDVIAYSTTVSSDETLKKDITIIPDSLAKVEAIKGVTFKWNKNDQASAGVIAQDVQKVLPELVRTVNDFDGSQHLAVNYSGLTSILIEAIKELSAKVKVLEAK